MNTLLSIGTILAMVGCVALIPLGLPGLWLMVVITMALVLAGSVGWTFGLVVAAVALIVEVSEFLVLQRFGRAFGGSSRAFWGAVLGGTVGLFVGVPIPIVGSVVTAFIGTFVGAGLVTYFETLSVGRSARVGWGVLLARTTAVGLKISVALGVIASVAIALFFGR